MLAFIGKVLYLIERIKQKSINAYYLSKFAKAGKDIYIGKYCTFTPRNICLGEHIYIGGGCVFQSAHGEIIIGNHVMFGPGVHIHGGNHIINQIGIYMDEAKKEPKSDGEVVIEDDVWVGSNAIILRGVHVGKGAVIGAGSIVTKDVGAYSVVVGNPARTIKQRFSYEEIKEHESILYKNNNKQREQ